LEIASFWWSGVCRLLAAVGKPVLSLFPFEIPLIITTHVGSPMNLPAITLRIVPLLTFRRAKCLVAKPRKQPFLALCAPSKARKIANFRQLQNQLKCFARSHPKVFFPL